MYLEGQRSTVTCVVLGIEPRTSCLEVQSSTTMPPPTVCVLVQSVELAGLCITLPTHIENSRLSTELLMAGAPV